MPKESPIVREVRERAMQIEERFCHDLHQYCQFLREQEQTHSERVVDPIVVVSSNHIAQSGEIASAITTQR